MQTICTHCGLTSTDGNLWCQRVECSSAYLTNVIPRGERLGDIEVGNLLRLLRTSAIYEATRDEEKIFLKLSHPDTIENLRRDNGYGRYIKNEADAFQKITSAGVSHPVLPTLLAPYSQSSIDRLPYGRIMIGDQLRYYEVFEYVEGRFLRDLLNDNPKPLQQHAGWLVIQLAELLAIIQNKLKLRHLALAPELVLVREDDFGILRPVLFDLGVYQQPPPQVYANEYAEWLSRFVHPAYTAPEMLQGKNKGSTDVYGLALILYEMLAGHPSIEFETKNDQTVRTYVIDANHRPLNRPDLPEKILRIVEQGLTQSPDNRYSDVLQLAGELKSVFGEMPIEKKKRRRWMSPRFRDSVLLVLLLIILVLIGIAAFAQ